jgi:hypothetical protein
MPASVEQQEGHTTSYVVDLMGVIRTFQPHENEPASKFAGRILQRILSERPDGCKFVHIVADRYDGMYEYEVNLKGASGCRSRRNESDIGVYKLEANLPIANWNIVLSSTKSKQELVRVLFETWGNSAQLIPSGVVLFLAGGFRDRKMSICIQNGIVDDCRELQSTHEEGDTRVILHAHYAARNQH